MFGLGWSEILLIIIFVLIVFGAAKIPEIGSAVGKGIRNFQKSLKGEAKGFKEGKEKSETEKNGGGDQRKS